jgi:hypothetical protein
LCSPSLASLTQQLLESNGSLVDVVSRELQFRCDNYAVANHTIAAMQEVLAPGPAWLNNSLPEAGCAGQSPRRVHAMGKQALSTIDWSALTLPQEQLLVMLFCSFVN